MTAWPDVERAVPEFAQRVRGLFDTRRHKTIATLRADGSPRIFGIEAAFKDGELVFGSMPNARKGADLRRDPRFALHSATVDPVKGSEAQWPGEAKISGRGDLCRANHRGARRRPLLRRHRSGRAHPPQRGGHVARRRVVTPTHGLRRIERG
jgi:Pyridoxamine 5'-phosphate oxidase